MEVLLHRLIVVSPGPFADCVDMIGIIEAIVGVIVAHTADSHR